MPGRPDISVQPTAVQLADGTCDRGSIIEEPGVHVDGVGGIPLTVSQARQFAAAMITAADELERLSVGELPT